MQIGKETKEIVYKYDTNMSDEEAKMFRDYADDNISIEELDAMLINWAIVDILKKQLGMKVEESTCQKRNKKSKTPKKKSSTKKLKTKK